MVAMVDEQLLTVQQVAERLQVTEWTVRDWLRTGRLKGFRLGGRKSGWRIGSSDFERFISEARAGQPE